jgi:transcriptional regulator GlxA family with amidase domain
VRLGDLCFSKAAHLRPALHAAGRPSQALGSVLELIADRFRTDEVICMKAENMRVSADIDELRRLRRARDRMDREYAQPLDVPALARTALMSPAHFSRRFREAYSETPYSYLMTLGSSGRRRCCAAAT